MQFFVWNFCKNMCNLPPLPKSYLRLFFITLGVETDSLQLEKDCNQTHMVTVQCTLCYGKKLLKSYFCQPVWNKTTFIDNKYLYFRDLLYDLPYGMTKDCINLRLMYLRFLVDVQLLRILQKVEECILTFCFHL